MKKSLVIIYLMLISTAAIAQTDGNYNYSIGLRGYSLLQLPKILNQTNYQDYTSTYLNGAIIKFNDNQISYRVSGNYLEKDISFNNQCNSCEIASGKVKDYSFKIGFEKSFNYSSIQPYFGIDLGFRSSNFTGNLINNNELNASSDNQIYNVETEKNGFVFGPILGVKFNILKQVSLFAETNLDFYYSYERQEKILNDANNTRQFVKYNKLETLFNPVSAGIFIHLVGNN